MRGVEGEAGYSGMVVVAKVKSGHCLEHSEKRIFTFDRPRGPRRLDRMFYLFVSSLRHK